MALVRHDTREVTFKIVYAGTPVSGKTTNLQYIHSRLQGTHCGDLVSLATSTDRTLYFDFVAVTAQSIQGYTTKFQLYTVPGQVQYNATRELVLRGADGIVFVADSQMDRLEENVETARGLMRNLRDNAMSLEQIPMVLQYNKRDLPNAAPVNYLNYLLNNAPKPFPWFESVASTGTNVFATVNAVSQLVLQRFGALTAPPPPADTRPTSAPQPAAVA